MWGRNWWLVKYWGLERGEVYGSFECIEMSSSSVDDDWQVSPAIGATTEEAKSQVRHSEPSHGEQRHSVVSHVDMDLGSKFYDSSVCKTYFIIYLWFL